MPVGRSATRSPDRRSHIVRGAAVAVLAAGLLSHSPGWSQTLFQTAEPLADASPGSDAVDVIRLGATLDLDGPYRELGAQIRHGLMAALNGATVQGVPVVLSVFNDSYDPDKTATHLEFLIERGVVAMVASMGSPPAKRALPILEAANVPAIGFVAGAGALRQGQPFVFNMRVGFVDEVEALVESALHGGVSGNSVCAMLPHYFAPSMLDGMNAALQKKGANNDTIGRLARAPPSLASDPVGPVVVYDPSHLPLSRLFRALESWRGEEGARCRLLLVGDDPINVIRIVEFVRYKRAPWVIAAPSFVAARSFTSELRHRQIVDRVVLSRIMPDLDADVPLLDEAREALGDGLNDKSLEGYMAGRLALHLLQEAAPARDVDALTRVSRGKRLDIGGVAFDYRTQRKQGLQETSVTYLDERTWHPMTARQWGRWR